MKLRVGLTLHIEASEAEESAARTVELQWASMAEQLEHILDQNVKPLYPDLKIIIGDAEDEED